MWMRWNQTTHIFEKSDNNGSSWVPLPLDGSIITEGTVPVARIPQAWPVGSIFIATVSTNPNTLLGYGTWSAFGAGRVLVGLNSGDADFDTVEETGGAKTHTLAVSEIPSHNHGGSTGTGTTGGKSATHTHDFVRATAAGSDLTGQGIPPHNNVANNNMASTTESADHTHSVPALTISSQGGGGAHNNVQPYIVVYMWKRTA